MKETVELDEYDRKLLYELDKDAQVTLSTLAKKIRRSKQFVEYRIKKLEDNNVIIGYHAIIDASKLGFFTYRIYFKFQQTTKKEEEELITFLKKYENIWSIAKLYGKWDCAFFVGVKTVKELHNLWDELMLKYKEIIKEYNVSVYAPVINFNKVFFSDKKLEVLERIYGDAEEEKYDKKDFKILKEYSNNVRTPLLRLAEKLKLSLNTIRYRIKAMEKNRIIVGYKLNLNLEILGFEGYRVDLHLMSAKRNNEIYNYCKHHKNIYQIMRSIGGSDFEMSIIVNDLYHLISIMEELKEKFKKVINHYEYFGFSAIPKLSFVPD
jgi:DNA-binding Lrp family transcriptional regulator